MGKTGKIAGGCHLMNVRSPRGLPWKQLPVSEMPQDKALPPRNICPLLRKLVPANPMEICPDCDASTSSTSNQTRPAEWHRCTAPAISHLNPLPHLSRPP